MSALSKWIMNAVLLPLDYFASGVLYQLPGMTISARCGIAQKSGESGFRATCLRALGALLDKIDPGHCAGAIEGDLDRISHTRARLEPWSRRGAYFGAE